MPERIDARPLITAAGGLLLLISLFLDWFSPGVSAWTAFETWDLILATIAIVAIAHGLSRLRGRTSPSDRFAPLLGLLAVLIVLSQLVDKPPSAVNSSLEMGAWLALGGAALLLLGVALSMAHISLSVVLDSGPRAGEARPQGPSAAAPPTEVKPDARQPPDSTGAAVEPGPTEPLDNESDTS